MKTGRPLSEEDLAELRAAGIGEQKILEQMELFRSGPRYARLERACTVGDGIVALSERQCREAAARFDREAADGRFLKFVPASGAATRMFKSWFQAIEKGGFASPDDGRRFLTDLKRFAFWDDLADSISRAGGSLTEWLDAGRAADIIEMILTNRGLDYGCLPKALLKFHAYPDGARTPLEEHLVEAALYVCDREGLCRIAYTVAEEHQGVVAAHLAGAIPRYEKKFDVRFTWQISAQKAATRTIAVDLDNRPFRGRDGRLLLRPAGHGALLENLNALEGEFVFIKNIDNVVPDRLKPETVRYKKVLGGVLAALREEVFRHLAVIEPPGVEEPFLAEAARFCGEKLNISFPAGFPALPASERGDFLRWCLDRPLRVCGMVRNEGEPGGGPFWVRGEDGLSSLQIVEEFQVEEGSPGQREIWRQATHFNPVDLACSVRDRRGRKYDLRDFVDPRAVCITRKSEKGRELKALELPGLWNGSMSRWNTVFIDLPIETFNPVKTIGDLLRPQHQPE